MVAEDPEGTSSRSRGWLRFCSSAADSIFDTLIYTSTCRALHGVPAPRKNRGRNRPLRPAWQDDAEMAGGIVHLTKRARHSHARLAVGHFRLRNGVSSFPPHPEHYTALGYPIRNLYPGTG